MVSGSSHIPPMGLTFSRRPSRSESRLHFTSGNRAWGLGRFAPERLDLSPVASPKVSGHFCFSGVRILSQPAGIWTSRFQEAQVLPISGPAVCPVWLQASHKPLVPLISPMPHCQEWPFFLVERHPRSPSPLWAALEPIFLWKPVGHLGKKPVILWGQRAFPRNCYTRCPLLTLLWSCIQLLTRKIPPQSDPCGTPYYPLLTSDLPTPLPYSVAQPLLSAPTLASPLPVPPAASPSSQGWGPILDQFWGVMEGGLHKGVRTAPMVLKHKRTLKKGAHVAAEYRHPAVRGLGPGVAKLLQAIGFPSTPGMTPFQHSAGIPDLEDLVWDFFVLFSSHEIWIILGNSWSGRQTHWWSL